MTLSKAEEMETSSPDDETPRQVPPIVFDTHGDLVFLVGPTKQSFRVCSRTVCRISPVFNRMLRGPWLESRPPTGAGETWTVELPDDNEAALARVFAIAHARFDQVSSSLSIEDLFDTCCVLNYYDCVEISRPYAADWCQNTPTQARYDGDDRLLWIAWVLGDEDMFKIVASAVMKQLRVSHDGDLVTVRSSFEKEFEYIDSIDILDDIAKARINVIRELLEPLHHFFTQALRANPKTVTIRTTCGVRNSSTYRIHHGLRPANLHLSESERANCQSFLMGAFTRATTAAGLFPVPKAEEVELSVNELYDKLSTLNFETRTGTAGNEKHWHCELNQRIIPLFDRPSQTFYPGNKFMAHVRAQGVKTGLAKPVSREPEYTFLRRE